MEDLIWTLLKLEIEQGRIVTARMDAVGKIRMLRHLGELEMTEEQFHRLSPALDEIDILREDRNFIVHGTWGRAGFDRTHFCLSLRLKPDSVENVIGESFPESRMRRIGDAIERRKWELIDLMEELHALPGRFVPKHHAKPPDPPPDRP